MRFTGKFICLRAVKEQTTNHKVKVRLLCWNLTDKNRKIMSRLYEVTGILRLNQRLFWEKLDIRRSPDPMVYNLRVRRRIFVVHHDEEKLQQAGEA